MPATRTAHLLCILCGLALFISACTPISPNFAQRKAQPKIPAARNFTSFSASLRCMDNLLASAKRGRTLISSTGIPDLTKKVNVSGDDMLVNAINQMNRNSKAYIFVDQSLEKDAGQISIFTPQQKSVLPNLYIRGAISQVDSNVSSTKAQIDATDDTTLRNTSDANASLSRGLNIVSVDMHLVSFPERTVVAGSSVANSMVVTNRSFGVGATGVIDMTGLNAAVQISRVESIGQAVRNLIELGAIELIGRHANIPYWECLNIPAVKQRQINRKEIAFSSADKPFRIPEVQEMLIQLGYYSGRVTGVLDQRTRDAISHFQAGNGLIATGDLNFDTYQHLQEKTKGFAPKRRVIAEEEIVTKVIETSETGPNLDINHFKLKPRAGEGGLAIAQNATRYSVSDLLRINISAPRSGYLSCFHQSGNGPIVQVFPSQPNVAFSVSRGQNISIPADNAGFDIKVEVKGVPEKIMCLLERDINPSDLSNISAKNALEPMHVGSFQQIISIIQSNNNRLLWGQIEASADK